ncbi:sigma-54 interaction domain-containing protein [Metabacillus sediminilitoris]|uniref:PAS domain-containing protein n=1 Tax=Metabacillus sediminilitoris TaxID=2567941 RepID=A0A4S4BP23_9BACI|nr:sigma 54-interacting transcriptional regulator [Metabacillus sediminilitoris]QGQ45581.1 PAS domain-containing protein [Metabacillus sediminilitoris]THF76645.1 PAS domain-containing protein [Metabacillus sediminilitoris]
MTLSNLFTNFDLDMETLTKILDYSSDEIFVLDKNKKIIYVNDACKKHYGLNKEDVMGKLSLELVDKGYWFPSIFPDILERKEPITIKQTTVLGAELLTSAVPILNEKKEVELIVTTARELQSYKMLKGKEKDSDQRKEMEDSFTSIITNNKKMKNVLKYARKVAATNSTILILGESGTGKSVLAQYIHENSSRKNGPFLTINCAAIPAELMESELFGYTPGAFTNANRSGKKGMLETVDRGTLFLDEIGDMPLPLQAKMLRVIQDKKFIPIGGTQEKTVDIRIITATNKDLYEMVKNKTFREDLYYRLNVVDITMLPLRERPEDISPLTYHFLYKFNRKYEMNKLISKDCLECLTHYSWQGNVRQLENLIEKLVITSDDVIGIHDLPEGVYRQSQLLIDKTVPTSLNEAIELAKKEMVRASYKLNRSSRRVAKDLQISQTQAVKLIREYCQDLQEN